jgi:DNA-binding NtrC family response regulator
MSEILVLVVTNDPGLRSLLRVCLRGNGHQLDMVPNGPAAMSKLDRQQYDVILLDYDRAGAGGTAVLQHVHDQHPHVRVVLMLETNSPLAAQSAATFGVQACLVKPFDPQAVEQILNSPCPLALTTRPARPAQCDPRRDARPGNWRSVPSDRNGQSRDRAVAVVRKDRS